MNANINSLNWSGTASISNTTHARSSSHSNAKENMYLPGFVQISSWVVLARDESYYVPWHSCWTKYNQDPVQVPHVMQESRWCPWYPKYRRWQVTHFMYYLSGSSSRGINTTNTEATIGHDPEPVLSTPFSHSLVSSILSYHFPSSVLAGKLHRIQAPSYNSKVYLCIKFFVEQVFSLHVISSREI